MSDSDEHEDPQDKQDKSEAGDTEESPRPKRRTKLALAGEDIWMHWTGKPGEHTPPLPSKDLSSSYVKVYLSSMEEAEAYAATGMWELKIPDGALRKTRPPGEEG